MIQEISLLKDIEIIQLLTRLREMLCLLLHFHECFGSSEEAISFPEIKGQYSENY